MAVSPAILLALQALPLIMEVIPGLIEDVQKLAQAMSSGELSPEDQAALLEEVKASVADKKAKVAAYQFQNPTVQGA